MIFFLPLRATCRKRPYSIRLQPLVSSYFWWKHIIFGIKHIIAVVRAYLAPKLGVHFDKFVMVSKNVTLNLKWSGFIQLSCRNQMVNRLCVQLNSLSIEQTHVPFRWFANLSTLWAIYRASNQLSDLDKKAAKVTDNLHDKSVICDTTLTTKMVAMTALISSRTTLITQWPLYNTVSGSVAIYKGNKARRKT